MVQFVEICRGKYEGLLKLNITNCRCIIKIKQENKKQFLLGKRMFAYRHPCDAPFIGGTTMERIFLAVISTHQSSQVLSSKIKTIKTFGDL